MNQTLQEPVTTDSAALSKACRHYLDALLCGNHAQALSIGQAAMAAGSDIRDIYLHLFQPALYEIGRLWEDQQISTAHEHLATSITRRVMAQLHALATTRLTPKRMFMHALNRTVVAACVGNEQHDIGLQMVADFFELEGWRVYYLGAMMPTPDILTTVNAVQASVLALSASLNSHVPQVQNVIRKVRALPGSTRIKILVGGHPFNHLPDLYERVGADITAPDARTAVARASAAQVCN